MTFNLFERLGYSLRHPPIMWCSAEWWEVRKQILRILGKFGLVLADEVPNPYMLYLVPLEKPEPVMCEYKEGCMRQAVTNPCAAEGGFRRIHHHGEVHTKDGEIKALCAEHGDIENARWGTES